jgi:hypothetical protein
VKRAVLVVILASIALNAALGIYALLAGEFGDLEARILFSSLSVSAAGILALACMQAWERRRLGPVPPFGVAASVAGFGLLLVAIWDEFDREVLPKTAGTLIALAVAASLSCLLSLATLASRFRWVFWTSTVLGFVLAAMFAAQIWGEWSDSPFGRALGVVAVLLAAFTVAVPILHRASRQEVAAAGGGAVRVAHCPRCGGTVAAAPDEETICPACGTAFAVRFSAGKPRS